MPALAGYTSRTSANPLGNTKTMPNIDPELVSEFTREEKMAFFQQMMLDDPGVFAAFVQGNEQAASEAKSVLKVPGRPRKASWLDPVIRDMLATLVDADAFDLTDDSDEDEILAAVDKAIAAIGNQTATTVSYNENGVTKRVRITFLSESASSESVNEKALKEITEASAEEFSKLVDKWRKSILRQRVDKSVTTANLATFDEAAEARRGALGNPAAATAPPPSAEAPEASVPPPA